MRNYKWHVYICTVSYGYQLDFIYLNPIMQINKNSFWLYNTRLPSPLAFEIWTSLYGTLYYWNCSCFNVQIEHGLVIVWEHYIFNDVKLDQWRLDGWWRAQLFHLDECLGPSLWCGCPHSCCSKLIVSPWMSTWDIDAWRMSWVAYSCAGSSAHHWTSCTYC